MSKTETEAPTGQTFNLQVAEKVHRSLDAIETDLKAAQARLYELMKPIEEWNRMRRQELAKYENRKRKWENDPDNVNIPFDPSAYDPPLRVRAVDPPQQQEFHRQHYAIGKLQRELLETKDAIVNG